MHAKRPITLVLAAVTAIAAITATAATGTTRHFDSSVSLGKRNPFHGHVSSTKVCRRFHRTVKVFKKRKGRPDHLFDVARTNDDGDWSLDGSSAAGRYYAKVARLERERIDGTKIVCDRAVSATRRF